MIMLGSVMHVATAAPLVKQTLVSLSGWGQLAAWKPGSLSVYCQLLVHASVCVCQPIRRHPSHRQWGMKPETAGRDTCRLLPAG